MKRVGPWLARGIFLAAVLALPSSISDTGPSLPPRADRALALVRDQDFSPLVDMAVQRIDEYFRQMREEEFLEEIFSLSGKWKAVTRRRESYERFVRKGFEKHLLNPAEFEKVLRKIGEDYAFVVSSSENRLLAAIFEDLRPLRPGLEFPSFRSEYSALCRDLTPCVLKDLGMNGVSILGSEAATVFLVAALTSAGILGGSAATGASGGLWTFGAGLVIGVAAGVAIDSIVGEDWEAAAAMELRGHLNRLRWQILDGIRDAVSRALEAHRDLQVRCVLDLYGGGRDGHLARAH
jgi:hypothetical protein